MRTQSQSRRASHAGFGFCICRNVFRRLTYPQDSAGFPSFTGASQSPASFSAFPQLQPLPGEASRTRGELPPPISHPPAFEKSGIADSERYLSYPTATPLELSQSAGIIFLGRQAAREQGMNLGKRKGRSVERSLKIRDRLRILVAPDQYLCHQKTARRVRGIGLQHELQLLSALSSCDSW